MAVMACTLLQADQIMTELEERWEEVRRAYRGDLQCVDAMVRCQSASCLIASRHMHSALRTSMAALHGMPEGVCIGG